ncbi:hypothetical protein F4604DRAFT_1695709 [Suillus subluteus]|nr:hypothetical protein F4604DRAFT_1695709 [Suillus subluteus]
MSQPHDHHVRFDVPMDTDEESLDVSSTGGETQQSMNFGFGKPAAIPRESTPAEIPAASQSKFNFGFGSANLNTPPAALDTPLAIPQSKFNFGFLPTNTDTPPAVPVAHTATQSKFNFRFTPTNTDTLPATQDEPTAMPPCKFNFGFTSTPLAVTVAPLKFNFGFASEQEPEQSQSSPGLALFNFGMEMNSRSPRSITPTPAPQPMNFGWQCPVRSTTPMNPLALPSTVASNSRHVGYDMSNERKKFLKVNYILKILQVSPAFQFDCGVSPARVGNWKPVPITASAPSASPDPPTTPLHLKGDEFDALARQMLGIVVGPGDELQQLTSPEVLQTNQVLMSALCETRDRLTRIFTDLINLHKIVTLYRPSQENAESKSSGSQ